MSVAHEGKCIFLLSGRFWYQQGLCILKRDKHYLYMPVVLISAALDVSTGPIFVVTHLVTLC